MPVGDTSIGVALQPIDPSSVEQQVDHLQQMSIHAVSENHRSNRAPRSKKNQEEEEEDGSTTMPATSCSPGGSKWVLPPVPSSSSTSTDRDEEEDTRTVWKMYTKTKGLFGPDSLRLENMSWRLMAFQQGRRSQQGMAIAAAATAASVSDSPSNDSTNPTDQQPSQPPTSPVVVKEDSSYDSTTTTTPASIKSSRIDGSACPKATPCVAQEPLSSAGSMPLSSGCNSSSGSVTLPSSVPVNCKAEKAASGPMPSSGATVELPATDVDIPESRKTLPTLANSLPSSLMTPSGGFMAPSLLNMDPLTDSMAGAVDLSLCAPADLLSNDDMDLAMNAFLHSSGGSLSSSVPGFLGTTYGVNSTPQHYNKLMEQMLLSGASLDTLASSSHPSLDSLDSGTNATFWDPGAAIARERALQKQLLAVQSALRAAQQQSLESMLHSVQQQQQPSLDTSLLHQPTTTHTATLPSTTAAAATTTSITTASQAPPTFACNLICHHCKCTSTDRWYQSQSFETPIILCRSCLEEFSGTKTVTPAAVNSHPDVNSLSTTSATTTTTTVDPVKTSSYGNRPKIGERMDRPVGRSSIPFPPPKPPIRESPTLKRSSDDAEASASSSDDRSIRRTKSSQRRALAPMDVPPTTTTASPSSVPFTGSSSTACQTSCDNCGTTVTPLWRRGINNQCLCNACGLYFKLHQEMRPPSMKTEFIKKRIRNGGPSDGKRIRQQQVAVGRNVAARSCSDPLPRSQSSEDGGPSLAAAVPATKPAANATIIARDEDFFMQSVFRKPSADFFDEEMDEPWRQ